MKPAFRVPLLTGLVISFLFVPFKSLLAQQPVASFAAETISGCAPMTVRFLNTSWGDSATYKWDLGNGTFSALENPVTTYFTPGYYNVTLTVTTAYGSITTTKYQYIKIYGKPVASFTANDTTGCTPFITKFKNLSTDITKWEWDFGDGEISTDPNPAHNYLVEGQFNVTLKVTNTGGCSGTISKQQFIKASHPPRAAFNFSQSVQCKPPEIIHYTNQSSGNGNLHYQWDFGNGNLSTMQNPANVYVSGGMYSVKLMVQDDNGCSDSLFKKDSLFIKDVVSVIDSPDSICAGSPVTLKGHFSEMPIQANWYFGDSIFAEGLSGTKTWNAPGLYTVKVVSNYPTCADSATRIIKVLSLPSVSISSLKTNTCKVPFEVNFKGNASSAVNWKWDFGDGNTSWQQSPLHIYNNYGTYSVKLTATDLNGCSSTRTNSNFIKALKPVVKIANLPAGGCIPFTIKLNSGSSAPDGIASYFWDFGNGSTSANTSPLATYTTTGAYNVKLIITTNDGCVDSANVTKGVKAGTKPLIDFSASPVSQCFGQPVQFNDLSVGVIDKWQWSTGDNTGSSLKNFQYTYKDTGSFSVGLIAWQNGCSDTLIKANYIKLNPPAAKFKVNFNCGDRADINFTDQSVSATSWLWDFGDGSTSVAQNPAHTYSPNKTYTVKLTVANNSCSNTISKSFTVAGLTPDFTLEKNKFCKSDSARFKIINNAVLNKYTWQFGDGENLNSTATEAFHKYTSGGLYTVTLLTEDANGCRDTITKKDVVQIFAPKAGFDISASYGCSPVQISFNDKSQTATGTNNIATWKWNFGDDSSQVITASSLNNGIVHLYADSGTYQPSLEITDSLGCTDTFSAVPLYIAKPKASFDGSHVNSCLRKSVQLMNTSEGKALSSKWYFSDGTSSNTFNPWKNFAQEGNYNARLVITDSFGCKDSIEKTDFFRVKDVVPAFTVDDSTGICVPFKVNFSNTSEAAFWQAWDFGDGSSSTLANPVHFYNEPGIYNVKLVAKRSYGCSDSVYKKIRVIIPSGSLKYNVLEACSPAQVFFNVETTAGVSYIYDFDDGTSVQSQDSISTHVFNQPGVFLPKVILKDSAGCLVPLFGTDSLRLYKSTADFSVKSTSFCDSGTAVFTSLSASGTALSGYNWNFGDGTGSTIQNPVHHYNDNGVYDVSLEVKNRIGCSDTIVKTKLVHVTEKPKFEITGATSFCGPSAVTLSGNLISQTTDTLEWKWSFGNGSTSLLKNPPVQQYNVTGNYPVLLKVTSNQGCTDSQTVTVNINPFPLTQAGNDTLICRNTQAVLHATGADNYKWQPEMSLSCSTCSNPVTNILDNTTFILTGSTDAGCKKTDTVKITVKQPFALYSAISADSVCTGETTRLNVSGAENYSWSPAEGLSNSTIGNPVAAPLTTTTYKVTGFDNDHCFKDTALVTVNVFKHPQVDAGADMQTSFGQSVILNIRNSPDVVKWEWTPAQTLSCTDCTTPIARPVFNTVYKVKVTNAGGCSASDEVRVLLTCDKNILFMPTAFTPNSDNLNDVFYPRSTGVFKVKSFRIFNRNGELVFINGNFQPNNRSAGWNGNYKGQAASPGNYLYSIEIICNNNVELSVSGNIILLR